MILKHYIKTLTIDEIQLLIQLLNEELEKREKNGK